MNCKSVKVNSLRKKIKLTEIKAKADPSLQLGKRTLVALQTLHKNDGMMISQLIKACEILEFSTEISMRCCQAFANSSATSILLDLIRSCNRSKPHQELLK